MRTPELGTSMPGTPPKGSPPTGSPPTGSPPTASPSGGSVSVGPSILEAPEPASARALRGIVAECEPRLLAIPTTIASFRPSPCKWSIAEIVGHLIDSASNNHQRFVRAIWQDDLVFVGYAQDAWVDAQRYQTADWTELIALWAAYNRHLAHVIAAVPDAVRSRVHTRHNLNDVAFQPPATCADATLDYFMADYVAHLEHHLRQIWTSEFAARIPTRLP